MLGSERSFHPFSLFQTKRRAAPCLISPLSLSTPIGGLAGLTLAKTSNPTPEADGENYPKI